MSEVIVRRDANSFRSNKDMIDYLNGNPKNEKRNLLLGLGAAAFLALASAFSGNTGNAEFLLNVISEPAYAVSSATGLPIGTREIDNPQVTETITPTITTTSPQIIAK